MISEMTMFPPYELRSCDIEVSGDTSLRDVGIPLDGTIIETPGHPADSISVLFDDGDCLIGDAASNVKILQAVGAKFCADLITNMGTFYESWEKVMRLEARWIYSAHGVPFEADKLKANLGKNEAENLVPYHPR